MNSSYMETNPLDQPLSSYHIVKTAVLNTHKHFFGLAKEISFLTLLFVCMFVPLWVWYIKAFGIAHIILVAFEMMMCGSLLIVALFLTSLYLFNKTQTDSPDLKLWKFTKSISYNWLIEGIKASIIVLAGLFLFIIPGIIKQIHYTFFSFVVFFNKSYKEGKIDCLKHSKNLTKGLGLWLLVFSILLPVIVNSIPGAYVKMVFRNTDSVWIIYPLLILCMYVVCLLFSYLSSILYFMYIIKDKNQI